MSSWQSGKVNANGIQLHYTRTGGNKPALVLAHGFSDDGLCWTPVAQALEADYDVIMVDARNHGQSDSSNQSYAHTTQADDLAGVIAALGLTRPLVLGHSMGAATALALAGTHPESVGAILLEDPPAWWKNAPAANPDANNEWQERMRTWITELKTKTRAELIEQERERNPGWSDAELGPWADSKLRLSPSVLNNVRSANTDWTGIVKQISCPVLLITADPERGALVKEEDAKALQELIPQTQIAHIPDAGHSIRRDQFGPYMKVVRAFLAEQR